MFSFKVDRDYYDCKDNLFAKCTIEIEQGITVLCGCNGSGKTTILKHIHSLCKKQHIPCISFDNLIDGGTSSAGEAIQRGDYSFAANAITSSEGETIFLNLGQFATKMGAFVDSVVKKEKYYENPFEKVFENPDAKKEQSFDKCFILMDAIDSGMSIDNIVIIKKLLHMVSDDILRHGIEPYVIVSANAYEVTVNEHCYDVGSCKYLAPEVTKTYDSYRKFILKTRQRKDKRFK